MSQILNPASPSAWKRLLQRLGPDARHRHVRATRRCSARMRGRRFSHSTAKIRRCPCPLGAPNVTVSSTTAMAPCRCTPPSIPRRARCWARRPNAQLGRVRSVPHRPRCQSTGGEENPRHRRQPLRAQDRACRWPRPGQPRCLPRATLHSTPPFVVLVCETTDSHQRVRSACCDSRVSSALRRSRRPAHRVP